MARGWHYTKLSLSSALLLFFFLACALCYCSFLFVAFVSFVFVLFGFHALVGDILCRSSSDIFPVQQTTYRIGNHVEYYWVRLRRDRLI